MTKNNNNKRIWVCNCRYINTDQTLPCERCETEDVQAYVPASTLTELQKKFDITTNALDKMLKSLLPIIANNWQPDLEIFKAYDLCRKSLEKVRVKK